MTCGIGWLSGVLAFTLVAGAGLAEATPQMLSEAKKAGMPVKSCQYCHTEALPKKETYKPESLNERGKFLMKDMQDRKLKAADMDKLKDYPGGKEQK
jgi:hypothetical protein